MARTSSPRKARSSSRQRIEQILAAARHMLIDQGPARLSIYGIAERAGLPPSSVYHFFPSVAALLEALTQEAHAAFRACLQTSVDHDSLNDWRDLSRIVEARMLEVYEQDAAARQLILANHGLTEVVQADRQHDTQLGEQLQALFAAHFHLPPLPDDIDIFTLAMELGDRVYARSVQQHGVITPRWAAESHRVFDAYLSLYLPPYLPKRNTYLPNDLTVAQ